VILHNIVDSAINWKTMPFAVTAHHVIVTTVTTLTLLSGKGVMIVGLSLMYEVTSSLYNISLILVRDSPLHKFCMTSFAITFIGIRWIFFPYITFIGDGNLFSSFAKIVATYPEEQLRIIGAKTMIHLFNLVNLYWGYAIVQKVFSSSKPKLNSKSATTATATATTTSTVTTATTTATTTSTATRRKTRRED
jgi:hypothetical protein